METFFKKASLIGGAFLCILVISSKGFAQNDTNQFLSVDLGISSFEISGTESLYDSWGGGFSYQYKPRKNFGMQVGVNFLQTFNRKAGAKEKPIGGEQALYDSYVWSSSEIYSDISYSILNTSKSNLYFSVGAGFQLYRRMKVVGSTVIREFDDQTGELVSVNVFNEVDMKVEETIGLRLGISYLNRISKGLYIGPKVTYRIYREGGNILEVGLKTSIPI